MAFLKNVIIPNSQPNVAKTPAKSGFLSSVTFSQPPVSKPTAPVSQFKENPKGNGFPLLNLNGTQVVPEPTYGIPSAISGARKAVTEAPKLPAVMGNPLSTTNKDDFLNIAGKTVEEALMDTKNRIYKAIDTWKAPSSKLQKTVDTASAGVGILNSLLSPITGTLKGAETVPVVGQVAHAINTIFTAVGGGASGLAGQAVDTSKLSPQTKEMIKPIVEELSALASQIALGKVSGKALDVAKSKVADLSKKVVDEVHNDATPKTFLQSVQKPETKAVIPEKKTFPKEETELSPAGNKMAEDFLNSQEDATISADRQKLAKQIEQQKVILDSLEGVGFKDTIKSLQKYEGKRGEFKGELNLNNGKGKFGKRGDTILREVFNDHENRFTSEELAQKYYDIKESYNSSKEKLKQLEASQKLSPKIEADVESRQSPEVKQSKVGTSVEAKSIEKGLTKGFGETAGYDPITIKDQAQRASKVMEDIEKARKMVKGDIPMESGLKGEMLIKAMEDYAQKKGDVEMLRDIANSPLVSETSAHAQAMRILAERDPDSVVAKLQDIKKAKEAQVEKKTGKKVSQAKKDVVKEIKKSMEVTKPKKEDWASFIKEIQCK